MVCINCGNKSTNVINSRSHRLRPSVWRRRSCSSCKTIVSTYESIAAKEYPLVTTDSGSKILSPHRLAASIQNALGNQVDSPDIAWELSQTIIDQLLLSNDRLTKQYLIDKTFDTISSFQPKAGLRYALDHDLNNKL